MKVEETGEFKLIELIKDTIGSDSDLLIGMGDDTCAWETPGGVYLATTDSLVEGIHFESSQARWNDLGYKALAVNLSDIAAMGGSGRVALVSLALPANTETENVVSFYQGMLELARETGISIGGGNISRSPVTAITVTVIGLASSGGVLKRSGVCGGDLIAITGNPGSSAAGRMILSGTFKAGCANTVPLLQAFLRPFPRLAEGQALQEKGASSCIDISDGLLADLNHVLKASGAGAIIDVEKLPLEPLLKAGFSHKQAVELCLTGGEDYELLFTASHSAMKNITETIGTATTVIGEIINSAPGSIEFVGGYDPTVNLHSGGWKHFG